MTHPDENTFYVTLTSQPTPEFPHNSPTDFQVRLPQSLWLQGKWKVGLANIFLHNPPNPIPHVVTTHVQEKVIEPPKQFTLEKLYIGTSTDIMFQLFTRGFKADDNSQSEDIVSKLKKNQLPQLKTGVLFFQEVYRRLLQDVLEKLPTGYRFTDGTNRWIPEFSIQNNTSLQLRHYQIDPKKRKTKAYFAINLKMAESMGWVVPVTHDTYELGNNLLMHLPDSVIGTKPNPADCNNSEFTFTQPFHVRRGLVYLSSVFTWQFIHLDSAFAVGTEHIYRPPLVARNEFDYIMTKNQQVSLDQGVADGEFTELSVSPHYWKRRVVGLDLVKDQANNAYDSQFSWSVWRKQKNQDYTLCVELYQTDKWLFDHAQVSLTASTGITLNHVKIVKHTHEYEGSHLLYYHKLEIQFNKFASSPPTYLFLNYKVENVGNWYANTLKNFMYYVVYGVKGYVDSVPDVYDAHPIIVKPKTTQKTQVVKHATKKESTAHPIQHGQQQHPTPIYMYSNLTKNMFGVNEIFKAFNYEHESTMVEFNPIQFHRLRNSFLDIVDIQLKQWDGKPLSLNPHAPSLVTLLFKKKVSESQRKYIRLDEPVERDPPI